MKSESNLSIISVLVLYIFILNLHRKANQESLFFFSPFNFWANLEAEGALLMLA